MGRDLLPVLSLLKGSRFNRNSFPDRRFASSALTKACRLYLPRLWPVIRIERSLTEVILEAMGILMILGLGPVVRYELITTARRGRFYLARVVYGLSLLVLLWTNFFEFEARHPAGGTVEQVREFAEATFIRFAGAQGAALLCLIPALVAGVIADEHQRKTLHYLLASQLSSFEIVIGKLGARLVHVGTYVALGIPVVCLLALYGGLNPENVFYVYLGTITMVVLTSGLSILVSTIARRPRDAVLATYGLGAVWLLGSGSLHGAARYLDGGALWWVEPVNDCVLLTNPAYVWEFATNPSNFWTLGGFKRVWFLGSFTWYFYWMVGLQTGFGLLFMGLAVFGLRPLRGSSWPGAEPQTGWWARATARARAIMNGRTAKSLVQNEILVTPTERPPCGDAPMLWKERYATMGGGLKWLGSRPVVLFFGVLLGCFLLDVTWPMLDEMANGKWPSGVRQDVVDALRGSSMALAVLGMLGVAASSAVSLTGEREQDTWISLATTLLTPAEIVRAKQFGAVWSARRVGLALLAMWAAGLLLGAIHPLGVLAAAIYVAVIAWLIATIGVFASSFAKNSTRALLTTFIALLIFSAISQWPAMVWRLLIPYSDLPGPWAQSPASETSLATVLTIAISIGALLAVQALAGVLLTLGAVRRLRATWGR